MQPGRTHSHAQGTSLSDGQLSKDGKDQAGRERIGNQIQKEQQMIAVTQHEPRDSPF